MISSIFHTLTRTELLYICRLVALVQAGIARNIRLILQQQTNTLSKQINRTSERDRNTLKKAKHSLQACAVLCIKYDLFPFYRTVMDGVDLDIEIGSHKYYPDFVREMRRLMNTDKSKQYLITAAPQCPFPDKWMGPQIQGSALEGVYLDCWHSVFL